MQLERNMTVPSGQRYPSLNNYLKPPWLRAHQIMVTYRLRGFLMLWQ